MVSAHRGVPEGAMLRPGELERWIAERDFAKIEENLNKLSPEEIGTLSVRTMGHLSTQAVGRLTERQLDAMTEFQVGGLSTDQLQAVWPKLPVKQMSLLTIFQLEKLLARRPAAAVSLPAELLANWDPHYLVNLLPKMTPEELKAVPEDALRAAEGLPLRELGKVQLAAVSGRLTSMQLLTAGLTHEGAAGAGGGEAGGGPAGEAGGGGEIKRRRKKKMPVDFPTAPPDTESAMKEVADRVKAGGRANDEAAVSLLCAVLASNAASATPALQHSCEALLSSLRRTCYPGSLARAFRAALAAAIIAALLFATFDALCRQEVLGPPLVRYLGRPGADRTLEDVAAAREAARLWWRSAGAIAQGLVAAAGSPPT